MLGLSPRESKGTAVAVDDLTIKIAMNQFLMKFQKQMCYGMNYFVIK